MAEENNATLHAKPAPAAAGGPPPPSPKPADTDDAQAFVLSRIRNEVYLLLDFISANPDTTFDRMRLQSRVTDLPADWLEKVCEITWPPTKGDHPMSEPAEQAALLLKVRDYLNTLARPASGATIAFTLMVTQYETERARRRRTQSESDGVPWRNSLALEAYPDLAAKARRFRELLSWIFWLPIGWLLFTLLISWYLAIGNSALTDFAAARANVEQTNARITLAQAALTAGPNRPGQAPAPPARTTYLPDECGAAARTGSYPSAELRDACLLRTDQQQTLARIAHGLDVWTWWGGPDNARWGANLLASAILPVLYGVLGAITAVVLSLSRGMKNSLLRPRDVQLSFQQLALGAVIGACIGLFVPGASGASSSSGGGAALLGPVALSSAALSFVAGFGADAVFRALDALISRIFNAPTPGAPAPGP